MWSFNNAAGAFRTRINHLLRYAGRPCTGSMCIVPGLDSSAGPILARDVVK